MQLKSCIIITLFSLIYGETLEKTHIGTIRRTDSGLIRGTILHSNANKNIQFYSFRGVPYAQPPVGRLRFQEPLPAKQWPGIKETIAPVNMCTQISKHLLEPEVFGSEDCLYIDIFEPITARKSKNELLPVMVWFHGGTFISGTGNSYGPDYLMEKPVILVVAQYRLNVFGFLSTKDENAKGNCGLKDQSFVLRWIKKNIVNFGGDPNKVTIFGESAGGASIQYHLLSLWSKGLFHGAISQSGSTLNRWALQEHPEIMVNKLAKGLGIKTTNNRELVKKLQDVDYNVLIKAAFNSSIVGFYYHYYAQPFAPIIESDSDTAFISETTFELLKKGEYTKVPYLMGYNTEEGSFPYSYINAGVHDLNAYEDDPSLIISSSLNVPKGSQCEKDIIHQIRKFYFNNGSFTQEANWSNYMNFELVVRGILKSMDFMYRDMPLYIYRVSYTGSRKFSYFGGVGHFEEVPYLLYPQEGDWNATETKTDKLNRKRMVTLWTNFATYGNPTPQDDELLQNIKWPTADPGKMFVDIGSNLTLSEMPEQAHMEFWENIFKTCGNPPYVTY